MTRDEAIKAFHDSTPNPASFADGAWIDRFVALGMLKLDEPLASRSSPEYKLYDVIFEYVPTLDFMPFKKLIDEAGLKIVEK